MAYISIGAIATTTLTSIYTVPAGKTVYLTTLMASNYSTAGSSDVTFVWRDASNGNADYELSYEVTVPISVVYNGLPNPGKFFLNEGDQILVKASSANVLKAILSVAEA